MPSTVSYQRKYYSVSSAELDTIPLKEGNVICTYDDDAWYYDVGNPAGSGTNVMRRKASGIEFVDNIDSARPESSTIFVMNVGESEDEQGNAFKLYAGYCWDNYTDAYFEVFNNFRDSMVKSTVSDSTRIYLTGTESNQETIGTLIKNPNIYITQSGNKLHANIEGNADTATDAEHAVAADLATRAINDNAASPKPITGYLNSVTSDYSENPGSILTFTRGDGTQTQVQVSDTKYNVYTSNPNVPGLVQGIGTIVTSDNTDLLLSGSGWIDVSNMNIPEADSAENDSLGQNISETYIKDLAFDNSERELTYTRGDDSTQVISIPDTSYGVFTSSADGLVPQSGGDSGYFLRGDATWQQVITPSDVYSGSSAGLVPAAPATQDKFLRSDGSWFGTFDNDEDGLVPKTLTAAATDILHADGSWSSDLDTKNTAGASQVTASQSALPLYLVGAESQTNETQTYSNSNVYILDNKLYSNNAEVIDVSSSQNLTNKTFNGNSLGSAAFVDTSLTLDNTSPSYEPTDVPTNNAVINYVATQLGNTYNSINAKLDNTVIAPMYSESQSYAVGDFCMYANTNGTQLYKCKNPVTAGSDLDPADWDIVTITDILKSLL